MRKTFKSRCTDNSQFRYIYSNNKHARDLKFVMYLPCMAFHKFGIHRIWIVFWPFNDQKSNMAAIFDIWFCAYCIYRWIAFFKKFITQAKNDIFYEIYCIFYISTRSPKITCYISFWTPPPLWSFVPKVISHDMYKLELL